MTRSRIDFGRRFKVKPDEADKGAAYMPTPEQILADCVRIHREEGRDYWADRLEGRENDVDEDVRWSDG